MTFSFSGSMNKSSPYSTIFLMVDWTSADGTFNPVSKVFPD